MSRLLSLFYTGIVITDGAWGTEFQKRGLDLCDLADLWNLTRPNDVVAVARAYVEAGSQVILTNTFRSNPIALTAQGESSKTAEINRNGVKLSKVAASGGVRVFGSLGPIGKRLGAGEVSNSEISEAFRVQSEALAEGGADALLFETFREIKEARLAVRAAKPTGLPIIVSFSFDSDKCEDQNQAMTSATPEAVGRAMAEEGADAVGANCGTGPEGFAKITRRLKAASSLPVWVKPSAGLPEIVKGRAIYRMTPEVFASFLPDLVEAGATFLGGCCGTNPDFIRALTRGFARKPDGAHLDPPVSRANNSGQPRHEQSDR